MKLFLMYKTITTTVIAYVEAESFEKASEIILEAPDGSCYAECKENIDEEFSKQVEWASEENFPILVQTEDHYNEAGEADNTRLR